MFKDVLKKDEKIVNVYKPHKGRFWFGWLLGSFWSFVWLLAGIFIPLAFDSSDRTSTHFVIFTLVSVGIFLVSMIISIIAGVLWYKHRFFAYTDRRILIRAGIIGIDYKSLEFKSLTATVVKVGVLDKIVRRNTGSLRFGSAASPILSFGSGHSNQYIFHHISKPYEVLREITEYIDDNPDAEKEHTKAD